MTASKKKLPKKGRQLSAINLRHGGMQGRGFNRQMQRCVLMVRKFCQKELNYFNRTGRLLVPLKQVQKRTAMILGIARSTVQKYSFKSSENEELTTPGKEIHREANVSNLDSFSKNAIAFIVYEYHRNREHFTLKDLLHKIRDRGVDFVGSVSSLRRVMRGMGFRFKKRCGLRYIREQPRITLLRSKFLRKFMELKKEGYHFIYMDETWYYKKGSFKTKEWQDSDIRSCSTKDPSTGARYILVHAGGKDGFVEGAELTYCSEKKPKSTDDYHGDMNASLMIKYHRELLIPNLPKGVKCAIIEDNAPYHKSFDTGSDVPLSRMRKEQLEEVLRKKGIEHEPCGVEQLKKLVKQHCQGYALDALMAGTEHRILRLPPYHPHYNAIELAWGIVKRHFDAHVGRFNDYSERATISILKEALDKVTPQVWSRIVDKTERIIMKDYLEQIPKDTQKIRPFIIHLGEDQDDDSTEEEDEDPDDPAAIAPVDSVEDCHITSKAGTVACRKSLFKDISSSSCKEVSVANDVLEFSSIGDLSSGSCERKAHKLSPGNVDLRSQSTLSCTDLQDSIDCFDLSPHSINTTHWQLIMPRQITQEELYSAVSTIQGNSDADIFNCDNMEVTTSAQHVPTSCAVIFQAASTATKSSCGKTLDQEVKIQAPSSLTKFSSVLSQEDEISELLNNIHHVSNVNDSMTTSNAVLALSDCDSDVSEVVELNTTCSLTIEEALTMENSRVLLRRFNIEFKVEVLRQISPTAWFSDDVINLYLSTLMVTVNEGGKKCHAMNTFFFEKLMDDSENIDRWTKNVNLFTCDLVIIPIHLGNHWVMCAIDPKNYSVKYYDSLGGRNKECLEMLSDYLKEEHRRKYNSGSDGLEWKMLHATGIPLQKDYVNCGVYILAYANVLCLGLPMTFNENDILKFRRTIMEDVMTGTITPLTVSVSEPHPVVTERKNPELMKWERHSHMNLLQDCKLGTCCDVIQREVTTKSKRKRMNMNSTSTCDEIAASLLNLIPGEENQERPTRKKYLQDHSEHDLKNKCTSRKKISDSQKLQFVPKFPVKDCPPHPPVHAASAHSNITTPHSEMVPHELAEPKPTHILFPPEEVVLGWRKKMIISGGFENGGNTCYVNAALQMLLHVPAFVHWVLHDGLCGKTDEECVTCSVYYTLEEVLKSPSTSTLPVHILLHLPLIGKHFTPLRQEDSHEFLRLLLSRIEDEYLDRFATLRLDLASKQTTPINQIFGGYLRQDVVCRGCKSTSTTFQHFMDLNVEVQQQIAQVENGLEIIKPRRFTSVSECLKNYFCEEKLGGSYECHSCCTKTEGTSKLSLKTLPKVLTIQLKRFCDKTGKLHHKVSHPLILNVHPYLHNQTIPNKMYKLISILCHEGIAMGNGHYFTYAQCSNRDFYFFNDDEVKRVPLKACLDATSSNYILCYELIPAQIKS